MKISLDKTIRAMAIALDLAEISSVKNSTIIEDISNINFSKHNYLNHSKRTAYISLKLGAQLNLPEIFMKELYISSLLHDIGASNFLKESHMTNTFILDHCKNGSNIIANFPVFSNISPGLTPWFWTKPNKFFNFVRIRPLFQCQLDSLQNEGYKNHLVA